MHVIVHVIVQFIVVAMLTYSTHKAEHLIKTGTNHTQIIVYIVLIYQECNADTSQTKTQCLSSKRTPRLQWQFLTSVAVPENIHERFFCFAPPSPQEIPI